MQGWLPRSVVYTLRSVQEVRVTSMHTLRVSIYANVGVSLFCLPHRLWKASNSKQAEVKHPLFLYVVINWDKNQSDFGCLSEQKEKDKAIKSNWQTIIRDSFHFWWHRTGKLNYAEAETIMTSHEQRGGFVMLFSAAFPVAYVTSMTPLRFFKKRRGFLCAYGKCELYAARRTGQER